MRTVVIGGSAAGLFCALLLARAGAEVLVLDEDPLPVAPDVESAAEAAFRRGAPQVVQPHAALPRLNALLAEHLPDVRAALLAAGAVEGRLPAQMPATLADRSARPGDEGIVLLLARRSTIDLVLRRAAFEEPGVELRDRTRVTGLLVEAGSVRGVRTDRGEERADLVVAAAGRRAPIDGWSAASGSRARTAVRAPCGLAYFSRSYRFRSGAALPGPPTTRVMVPMRGLTAGLWPGDNGAAVVAIAPLVADARFRPLRRPDVFEAVLRTLPALAPWAEGLEPAGPVRVMGGLDNVLRLPDAPLPHGLVAVGDVVCATNPTFGRGLPLALLEAVALAGAVRRDGAAPGAAAAAVDDTIRTAVRPYYEDQARNDEARLAGLRSAVLGLPAPPPSPIADDRVTFAEIGRAAQQDPTAFRAFWHVLGMLREPAAVYRDPAVVTAVRAVLRDAAGLPGPPEPDPAALATALAA